MKHKYKSLVILLTDFYMLLIAFAVLPRVLSWIPKQKCHTCLLLPLFRIHQSIPKWQLTKHLQQGKKQKTHYDMFFQSILVKRTDIFFGKVFYTYFFHTYHILLHRQVDWLSFLKVFLDF